MTLTAGFPGQSIVPGLHNLQSSLIYRREKDSGGWHHVQRGTVLTMMRHPHVDTIACATLNTLSDPEFLDQTCGLPGTGYCAGTYLDRFVMHATHTVVNEFGTIPKVLHQLRHGYRRSLQAEYNIGFFPVL